MANEFKIKKGLIVTGASGGTVVDIQGSQGQLFSVTDDLSGSIFAVSDISGVPIFDVNSSGLSTFDGNLDINGSALTITNPSTPMIKLTDTTNNLQARFRVANSYAYLSVDNPDAVGSSRIVFQVDGGEAAYFDSSLNATFAGTIGSGAITSTGIITGTIFEGSATTVNLMSSGSEFAVNLDNSVSIFGAAFTGTPRIVPATTAEMDLGTSSNKWKDLHISGDANFGDQAFATTATSSGDASSTLTTKGYVDSLITGATIYRGTWDPDKTQNSGYGVPDLSAVTQTSGYYYICSDIGIAEPNGAGCEPNSWAVGDWVIWNDDIADCAGTGTGAWQKIDNSSVLSGAGDGQTVALWEGTAGVAGQETLGNAPITVSGNDTTFAGLVSVNNKFKIANNGTATWGAANDYGQLSWDTGYALIRGQSNRGIKLQTNSSTTALTLDTSQNATFAGSVFAGRTTDIGGFAADDFDLMISNGNTDATKLMLYNDAGNYHGAMIQYYDNVMKIGFSSSNSQSTISNALELAAATGNATFTGGTIIKGNGVVYLGYTDATAIGGNKLEVNGNIYGSGNATFASDVTATANYTAGNSKIIYKAQRSGGAVAGDWSYDDATTDMSLGTSTAHSFSLKTGNTRALTINTDGMIGIGKVPDNQNVLDIQNDNTAGSFTTHRNNTGFALNRTYADYGNDGNTVEYQERIGTDGNNSSIGNFSNHTLGIRTNNQNRITILSGGNVGIGVTGPIEKLQVVGQLISTGSSSTSATVGVERAIMDLSNYSATDHSARFGHFRGAESAGAGQLRLYTDSVERLRIDAGGNVGIGYSSPSDFSSVSADNLVVGDGTGSNGITVFSATNAYGNLAFADGTGASDQYRGLIQYGHTLNSMQFFTNVTERMVINSVGAIKFNAYDSTNNTGTPTYMLGTDASGNVVKVLGGDIPGVPAGSGTLRTIPMWTPDGDTLGDSVLKQDAANQNIGIGITPESGMVTYINQLRIGEQSGFQGHANGVGQASATWVTTNYKFTTTGSQFINGTVANPGYAMVYQQQLGNHTFETSNTTGVAGGTVTLTNQMTILQNGNVGIGTTGPLSKLELGPTGSLGTNITNKNVILNIDGGYGTTGTPSSGQYKVIGFTGTTRDVSDITGQTGGETSKNFYAGIIGGDYFNSNRFSIWQNGVERLTILGTATGSGNVGIGETSPAKKLHVKESTTATYAAYIENTIAGGDYLAMIGDAGDNVFEFDSGGTGGEAVLKMYSDGVLKNQLVANGTSWINGNVAIGATSSTKKLTVNGSFKLGTNAYIEYGGVYPYTITTANTAAVGNLVFSAGLGSAAYESRIDLQGTNTAGVAGITLSTAATARMVVTADGDVGIGTTTPLAKLDIQGTQGQLFSVTDDLSGSIFAVSDISGVPIFDVNSSGVSYFDGNVGIGETNPSCELHVKGDSSSGNLPTVKVESTGSISYLKFFNSSTGTGSSDGTYIGMNGGTAYLINKEAGNLYLGTGDAINLTLENGGNVGIGVTNPVSPLTIKSNSGSSSDSGLTIQANASTNTIVKLGERSNGRARLEMFDFGVAKIAFYTDGNNNYINAGNVGINRTSLVEKFEVGGDSAFYGAIKGYTGSSSNQYLSILQSVQGNTYISTGTSGETINFSTGSTQNVTNISVAGTATATNFILSSDETLKDNVKEIDTKHIDVEWKSFELKSEPGVKRSGVIAQELEKKNPEFVRTDDKGLKSVAYIDLLISKIAELEARLEKAGI